MQNFHAKFLLKLTDQSTQPGTLEFDYLTTIQTREMMVVGCPNRFEVFALMGAGQVAPFNESHFCQHGQGPVYYSQADVCVLFTCPREDAFGIEVFSAVSITSSTIWRWRVTRRHPFARQPVFQYE